MRRQLSSLPDLLPILLLSVVVLWVPLAWGQAPRLTQVSFQPSDDAVPLGAFQEAKALLFTSYGKMPLSFAPNLSQIQSGPRPLCSSGDHLLLPTNRPVLELAGKPNYLITNAPKRWLANVPTDKDYQTFDSYDLKYWGHRTPLVGWAILRIDQQLDSHPRLTRWLQVIEPQF